MLAKLFLELSILGEKHWVFLLDILIFLLVAVTAQKHMPFVKNRCIIEINKVKQNPCLFVWRIVENRYGLMIHCLLIIEKIEKSITTKFLISPLHNDNLEIDARIIAAEIKLRC